MAGLKEKLLYLLLMLLVTIAVGCINENLAVEDLERQLTASSSKAELPSWLLLVHRSETLSNEDLGFVVIESEYRVDLEKEKNENDDLELEPEDKKSASSSTVKASSAGSSSGYRDDNRDSSFTAPQQSSNSGSWWELSFSNNSKPDQPIVHNVRYDLEE